QRLPVRLLPRGFRRGGVLDRSPLGGGLLELGGLELGGLIGLLVMRHGADDFLVGRAHLLPPSPGSSSTISASTTSDSAPPSAEPSVDSPSEEDCCALCEAWAAAYIACPMAAALVFSSSMA